MVSPAVASAAVLWLLRHGIDPKEPCKGSTALGTLKVKLQADFGVVSVHVNAKGDLCNLLTGEVLIHRDDARSYLWGAEVKVTVEIDDDGELETVDPLEDTAVTRLPGYQEKTA